MSEPAHRTETSVCVLCSQNCGLKLDVLDNRIVKVRADESNPFSEGYTCNKAYRIGHYVQHAQRVNEPLKRQPDGSYAPISWDQACSEIGERLRGIVDTHGPDAFALLGVGGQGNHLSVTYALSLLTGIGSRWWFNALAQEKTQRSLVDGWMAASPPACMLVGHPEEAELTVILGSNPAVSQRGVQPHRMLRAIQKDPGRRLVVVDPRATETARRADRHLPIRAGTDLSFLVAFTAVIVQEERYDREHTDARCTGMDAVLALFGDVDVDEQAARCGLPAEQIRDVARDFAAARRATLDMDLGVEQSHHSTLTAWLVRLILALTDNYARVGGSVFVSSFSPRLPRGKGAAARAPVSGIPGVTLMAPLPMFSPALFPEEVLDDRPTRIRAVIVEGSNPLLTYPGAPRVREAFEALELSVVIDPAFTETARVADYVLPAPVNYEKWEVSAFPKPFPLVGAQVRAPSVEGPAHALPEPEIYRRIARAMGLVRPAPRLLHALTPAATGPVGGWVFVLNLLAQALLVARSLRRAVPTVLFWLMETLGPTLVAPQLAAVWAICQALSLLHRADIGRAHPELARLRNPLARGQRLFELVMAHPEGAVLGRLDEEGHLDEHCGHEDGRIRLAPGPMVEELERVLALEPTTDADYPFVLDGGMRTHWTANTNFRDPAWRRGRGPHCALRLSTVDAERLGIAKGDRVRVRSRVGVVELPALPEEHVQVGHVHIPNGFGQRYPAPETGELRRVGVNINELTDPAERDRFTGCPHHKLVRCQIERVDRPA